MLQYNISISGVIIIIIIIIGGSSSCGGGGGSDMCSGRNVDSITCVIICNTISASWSPLN
jgi:hypothetical protein